jgi:hypothetical protein
MSDSREGPIWARHGEGDEPGRPRRRPALALWVALLAAALLVGALLAVVSSGDGGQSADMQSVARPEPSPGGSSSQSTRGDSSSAETDETAPPETGEPDQGGATEPCDRQAVAAAVADAPIAQEVVAGPQCSANYAVVVLRTPGEERTVVLVLRQVSGQLEQIALLERDQCPDLVQDEPDFDPDLCL